MKQTSSIAFLFIATTMFFSCKKSSNSSAPTTGQLQGIVKDAVTLSPLQNVSVVVFNADNNSPIGQTLQTNASGQFSTSLAPGNYFVKLSRQGYYAVPPPSLDAVAFAITLGQLTESDAQMFPLSNSTTGWIVGKVTSGGTGVAGALVVATDSQNKIAFSTSSDQNGDYSIFNIPAGSFNVQAYLAFYNSSMVAASVTSSVGTTGINIDMQKNANAVLTGLIRNLAIDNKDVDVSLVHPITKETIPGLTTSSVNLAYSLANIPNGTFIARASYKNDLRVMDPDAITKFGEPTVTVSAGSCSPSSLTFDVTGPVTLNAPTNPLTTTIPVAASTRPVFSWTAYPSTSDYVIEVMDASTGQLVWGGFDKSGPLPVKKIIIPSNQTSITYNSNSTATISDLVPGKIYRWRIYASKNDVTQSTGWSLISTSEDQVGLIKIPTQ
ncbi:MAG TPA: carboxypeptidase-like regulatory domain-containing protein [Chitinophagaceae bacterium]|nr:carboxypeptidase-like regulatory domain-containing protein [Chitinophagaceae bacterium]